MARPRLRGVDVVDQLAVDQDLAVGDLLEPGDHPQQGRLAATRRADEDHELAVLDLQVDAVDRPRPARSFLTTLMKLKISQGSYSEKPVAFRCQRFIAEVATPWMIRRWKKRKKRNTGSSDSVDMANSWPQAD